MGVLNLSLSQGPDFAKQGTTSGILVYEREDSKGARDLRLVWSTEWGTPRQKQWVITMSARAYPKGDVYQSKVWYATQTFDSSECHETKPNGDSGRVWWSHDLDISGLLSQMAGSSGWMYETRVCDTIDFEFSVHSIFNEPLANGQTTSDTAWLSVSMGYCPEYTITAAYYDTPDYLTIEYATTWTRKDDRFWLSNKSSEDGGMCTVGGQALLVQSASGTVNAIGKILVPTDKLSRHVMGDSVYLNVFWNAAYRPVSLYFNHATATVTVQNRMDCSNVALSVRARGEDIELSVTSKHDSDTEPDYADVKMDGGKYSFDNVRVEIGGTAVFRYPPFNRDLTFSAVGRTEVGGTSKQVATATVRSNPSDFDVIDGLTSGTRIKVRYRKRGAPGVSVKATPSVETVKLAGRRRPAAYYGVGGSATVKLKCVALDDNAEDFEALADGGEDVLIRFRDGRRYAISPEVKIDRDNDRVLQVEVSGGEVSA